MPTLIQFWDQPPAPATLEERMRGWRQANPEWRQLRFDRRSAADFIAAEHGPELAEAFLDLRLPAMMADVFRVAYLVRRGGLWLDAATLCLSPLASWLDPTDPRLLLLRRPHQKPPGIWNGLIHAAEPGHPFLAALWSAISQVILARSGQDVWAIAGPGLYKETLRSGAYDRQVRIMLVNELADRLMIDSSGRHLPKGQHWTNRQRGESLYFSVSSPAVSDQEMLGDNPPHP